MIENYKYRYRSRGKFIFAPNERCERKGRRIIKFFSRRVDFPSYFFHYKPGGHIAALHGHLQDKLFFRIDIQNFYYSIARMRVTRALQAWRFPGANTAAKWSCVVNPYGAPRHALPIGFVQSPLLATLVLMKSPVAKVFERWIDKGVRISVYLDDIVGSYDDQDILGAAYAEIRDACASSGFIPNASKLAPPQQAIKAFNCDITYGSAEVTAERVEKFFAVGRSQTSYEAFQDYRRRVASKNFPVQ
jgi:hypothetical protein